MERSDSGVLSRASGALSASFEERKKRCTLLDVMSLLFFVLIVGGALITIIVPSSRDALWSCVQWARANTAEGLAAYTAFFAIGAIACFPEVMLAAVAGYIFPLAWAAAAVWIGSLVGSAAAFQLGRLLFKDKIRRCIYKRGPSTLRKLDAAFVEEGWKIVLIIRLPYIPLVWVNYVLSATTVDFATYTAATALGIIPGCFFYCYLGAGIGNLQGFIAGTEKADTKTVVLTVVGWVLAIVAFILIFRYAKRRLAERGLDSIVEQREDTDVEGSDEDVLEDGFDCNAEGAGVTHRSRGSGSGAGHNLTEGLLVHASAGRE